MRFSVKSGREVDGKYGFFVFDGDTPLVWFEYKMQAEEMARRLNWADAKGEHITSRSVI